MHVAENDSKYRDIAPLMLIYLFIYHIFKTGWMGNVVTLFSLSISFGNMKTMRENKYVSYNMYNTFLVFFHLQKPSLLNLHQFRGICCTERFNYSTISDIDECRTGSVCSCAGAGSCGAKCTNTAGSYHCSCGQGYRLQRNTVCTGTHI